MARLSLIDGPVPVVVLVLAALAAVVVAIGVLGGRARIVGVVAALVLGGVGILVVNPVALGLLDLLPEPLPTPVVVWIAVGVAALTLVVAAVLTAPWQGKALALGCAVLMVAGVAVELNRYFDEYGTLGDLLMGGADIGVLPAGAPRPSRAESTPVVTRWAGDASSGTGQVDTAMIPASVSGFAARPAYVYLPPAYLAPDPPLLPVLVLVAGQPGGPRDWVISGRLRELLDEFAAQHRGLAPVTVVVDPNGSQVGNTMCMDSQIGNADTYLAQDVPAWITSRLGVDANPAHWAFGGWSFGGTCALQMATRHPDLYPQFIDMAGEREPALSANRQETVQRAFGGDTAAFDAQTPLTLLAAHPYPGSAGYFSAGGDETTIRSGMVEVATAAQQAGMDVQTQVVAGQGHSWRVAQASVVPALEWLAPRMGFAP